MYAWVMEEDERGRVGHVRRFCWQIRESSAMILAIFRSNVLTWNWCSRHRDEIHQETSKGKKYHECG